MGLKIITIMLLFIGTLALAFYAGMQYRNYQITEIDYSGYPDVGIDPPGYVDPSSYEYPPGYGTSTNQ